MLWLLIPLGIGALLAAFMFYGKKWAKRYKHLVETLRSLGLTVNDRPPLVASGMYQGVDIAIGTERRTSTTSTVYDVVTIRGRCLSPLPDVLAHRLKADSMEFQSTMGLRTVRTGNTGFDGQFKTLVKDDAGAALWADGSLARALLAITDPASSTDLEDFRVSAGDIVLAFQPAWLTAPLAKSAIECIAEIASAPVAASAARQ